MKILLYYFIYCVGTIIFNFDANAQAVAPKTHQVEVEVENVPWGDEQPPCLLRVPNSFTRCSTTGCEISLDSKANTFSFHLSIQCIPIGAPTQYDNPAPELEMRFKQINTPVFKGFVASHLDDTEGTGSSSRKIGFCLFSKDNRRVCGETKEVFNKQRSVLVQQKIESLIRDISFPVN